MEDGKTPKSVAYPIAVQQAHAVKKSPKDFRTPQGVRTAKKKYDEPKMLQKSAQVSGMFDELEKIALSSGLLARAEAAAGSRANVAHAALGRLRRMSNPPAGPLSAWENLYKKRSGQQAKFWSARSGEINPAKIEKRKAMFEAARQTKTSEAKIAFLGFKTPKFLKSPKMKAFGHGVKHEIGPAMGATVGAGIAKMYGVDPLAGAAAGYGIGALPDIISSIAKRAR
jgi:hypothetical protein